MLFYRSSDTKISTLTSDFSPMSNGNQYKSNCDKFAAFRTQGFLGIETFKDVDTTKIYKFISLQA